VFFNSKIVVFEYSIIGSSNQFGNSKMSELFVLPSGNQLITTWLAGKSPVKSSTIFRMFIFDFFKLPIGSMYGIYANIGGILMVNVTIYSIHGSYGIYVYYQRVPTRLPWDSHGRPSPFFQKIQPGCSSMFSQWEKISGYGAFPNWGYPFIAGWFIREIPNLIAG